MNNFPSLPASARLVLGSMAFVGLLAGCHSGRPTAQIGVSSPPPPMIGSAPITAYDDYARVIAPANPARAEAVAQLDSP